MTSTPARPRIVATMRRDPDRPDRGSIRVDDLFDTDVEDLWSALTEPSRLSRWLAEVSGDLRVGGEIHARFVSSWDGPARIDTCREPHQLSITMGPGADDETVIEATLTPEDGKTRLVIEEHGLPVTDLPYHGAGWAVHYEDLAAVLRDEPASDWRSRWVELTPTYKELPIDGV